MIARARPGPYGEDLVEPREVFRRELDFGGRGVLLEVPDMVGPRNRHDEIVALNSCSRGSPNRTGWLPRPMLIAETAGPSRPSLRYFMKTGEE